MVALLTLLFTLMLVGSASGVEAVNLSASAGPVEDVAMTVTAQGTANGTDKLWVFVESSSSTACSSDPGADDGTSLSRITVMPSRPGRSARATATRPTRSAATGSAHTSTT